MSSHFGRRLYATLWDTASSRIVGSSFLPSFFESNASSRLFQSIILKRGLGRLPSATAKRSTRFTRKFASGSFLILGVCPNSTAVETGTTCAKTPEKIISQINSSVYGRRFCTGYGAPAWARPLHTSSSRRSKADTSKEPRPEADSSSASRARNKDLRDGESTRSAEETPPSQPLDQQQQQHGPNRHLMDRLPHMPHLHRPTKEELLAAATGFWSRLKVRFKWFSIRSVRPFTFDEISALFSWVLLGHVVWVVLGTTTFFSLLILAINTVFAQEKLAGWVGNYLTKSSGVKVVFESAIVPEWRGGVITFKNVFVSRRPGQGTGTVKKGSPKTAAAVAAAAASGEQPAGDGSTPNVTANEDEDTNYTQFDLSIDTVNVTLSFTKWLNGKGLLRNVEVKGIRGVVDRRHVHWTDQHVDPKSYRLEHQPGDFEIDSFKMEDVLVTIYQPNNFRPFSVSIFSCDLPQLRKQWLFYDFCSANMMSGSFDNSLFTIHPRQTHSVNGSPLDHGREADGKPSPWKKQSRLRIDGLNIDHLNRGVSGPFGWIHEGNVDIVADIMFPADDDESLAKVMSDFYDRLEATVTTNRFQDEDSEVAAAARGDAPGTSDDKRVILMDLRLHLNNVRAAVPIFTKELSYINNALIRPIVAYINSRRTFIPINCRLVKRLSDFDGSWTIFDSALMDDLSVAVYEAFARDVVDDQARKRRFKKVGFWSLQLAAQAIFMGMAGNIA